MMEQKNDSDANDQLEDNTHFAKHIIPLSLGSPFDGRL